MAPRKHGPDFSLSKTWEDLSKNIREIQNHNASNLSFEENHRYAYNMVLYKHGETLYNGVRNLVIENLETLAGEEIVPTFPTGTSDPSMQNDEEDVLLKALRKVWDDHRSNMVRLGQILKYMDRSYTKDANVPDTHNMGLQLFLDHIIKPPIKDHLVSAILSQVRHERDGESIHRSTVKGCVDVFLSLEVDRDGTTVYKRDLEPVFLSESQDFYEKEGKRLLHSCDGPEFLRLAEERFEAEASRTNHYLSSQTTQPLLQVLKDNLLTPHLESVISKENSGLDAMVDNSQFDHLSRLFRLCRMVPTGIPCLQASLKKSIIRRGREINQVSLGDDLGDANDAEDVKEKGKGKAKASALGIQPAVTWVQDVLALKDKFDIVWQNSFQSNRELEITLNDAFGTFVNQNEKCSEFISLFIDDNLRRGIKGKTDLEVEAILDKTITIFRFISEKDVFERYYKGHLAKRLLHSRSASDDAEHNMLTKLKIECGVQFTQKMEGMFNDMKISADTTKSYLDHVSKTTAPEIELSVTVMTSNAWPMTNNPSACILPSQMDKACKSFEQFYHSKHSGRRLDWQLNLGNADVHVRFQDRSHELNVSTLALVILLLFENLGDDETLSYSDIKGATSIEPDELKRQLQSLACAKYKVLRKHPSGRDVKESDTFSFNHAFTCPMKKVKIGTISNKVENKEERKETLERIDEERRYQTDACIVRIMKDRKHMKHNDLVNQVTAQLTSKFSPEPMLIKKRIEHLIEKEYLERCEDRKSYNYLA
ncbi:Cullin-domain-containing protein [Pholiota conissans]|uniref:Cullin-domain-containing protein n=1 Tax=Pholiota conissans TaxID=109636 RepID=A0A9P5Z0J7_9AGAR|nr:Cullin-domain-containing protein [Pholiota conissans]